MTRRIIDLSLTVRHGARGVSIEPHTSIQEDGYNTTTLTLYSHALTHMDAPRHFLEDGPTIDQIELQKCVGPAVVIHLSNQEPNSLIRIHDLGSYAERIGPGSRVILRTDWDTHADLEDYRTDFPRISLELAQWLVERGVWLLGVQTPSVASLDKSLRQELTDVHQTLLKAGIVIVESLASLAEVDRDEGYFVALPLKIQAGDGSPTRPIIILEEGY